MAPAENRRKRQISREGMVSVGGNFYSVPDATPRPVVEVHTLADEIRIFEDGALIAAHPVLESRHQRRVAPGHRKSLLTRRRRGSEASPITRTGDVVAQCPLEFYDTVARHLAREARVSAALELIRTTLERMSSDLVGLKMPHSLEALDAIVRRLEQGEIGAHRHAAVRGADPARE